MITGTSPPSGGLVFVQMIKMPIRSYPILLKRGALKTLAACACLAFIASPVSGNSGDADRLARLEFNGFVTLGKGPTFNLSDPEGGWTAWVGLAGVSAGVSVLEFDREARLLTVAMGEETRQIRLKADKIGRMALSALSRGDASPEQDAVRESREHERKMANLVSYDMALNHMVRQQRERDRLRGRAMKAQAAATGD